MIQILLTSLYFFVFESKTIAEAPNKCLTIEKSARQFLDKLPGKWIGAAPKTPLGKLPYNLEFKTISNNSVQGKSETNGQAIHTWTFQLSQNNKLILDFHSTFGNSHAKGLCVTQIDPKKGFLFSKGSPNSLKLWVGEFSMSSNHFWQADILLRDQSHVTILVKKLN